MQLIRILRTLQNPPFSWVVWLQTDDFEILLKKLGLWAGLGLASLGGAPRGRRARISKISTAIHCASNSLSSWVVWLQTDDFEILLKELGLWAGLGLASLRDGKRADGRKLEAQCIAVEIFEIRARLP